MTNPSGARILAEVANVHDAAELLAAQVREIDNEPRFTLFAVDVGVSEPYTAGDVLDVLVLALQGIIDGHSGRTGCGGSERP